MSDARSFKWMLVFARLALAAAFLSAVADRFGFWGLKGDPGVSWGSIQGFMPHVALLCPWAPLSLVPSLAWGVTGMEAVLGVLLLVGFQVRLAAAASFCLLAIFAVSMGAFQSMKLMLNFSVMTCAACAGLVYLVTSAAQTIEATRTYAGVDQRQAPAASRT